MGTVKNWRGFFVKPDGGIEFNSTSLNARQYGWVDGVHTKEEKKRMRDLFQVDPYLAEDIQKAVLYHYK